MSKHLPLKRAAPFPDSPRTKGPRMAHRQQSPFEMHSGDAVETTADHTVHVVSSLPREASKALMADHVQAGTDGDTLIWLLTQRAGSHARVHLWTYKTPDERHIVDIPGQARTTADLCCAFRQASLSFIAVMQDGTVLYWEDVGSTRWPTKKHLQLTNDGDRPLAIAPMQSFMGHDAQLVVATEQGQLIHIGIVDGALQNPRPLSRDGDSNMLIGLGKRVTSLFGLGKPEEKRQYTRLLQHDMGMVVLSQTALECWSYTSSGLRVEKETCFLDDGLKPLDESDLDTFYREEGIEAGRTYLIDVVAAPDSRDGSVFILAAVEDRKTQQYRYLARQLSLPEPRENDMSWKAFEIDTGDGWHPPFSQVKATRLAVSTGPSIFLTIPGCPFVFPLTATGEGADMKLQACEPLKLGTNEREPLRAGTQDAASWPCFISIQHDAVVSIASASHAVEMEAHASSLDTNRQQLTGGSMFTMHQRQEPSSLAECLKWAAHGAAHGSILVNPDGLKAAIKQSIFDEVMDAKPRYEPRWAAGARHRANDTARFTDYEEWLDIISRQLKEKQTSWAHVMTLMNLHHGLVKVDGQPKPLWLHHEMSEESDQPSLRSQLLSYGEKLAACVKLRELHTQGGPRQELLDATMNFLYAEEVSEEGLKGFLPQDLFYRNISQCHRLVEALSEEMPLRPEHLEMSTSIIKEMLKAAYHYRQNHAALVRENQDKYFPDMTRMWTVTQLRRPLINHFQLCAQLLEESPDQVNADEIRQYMRFVSQKLVEEYRRELTSGGPSGITRASEEDFANVFGLLVRPFDPRTNPRAGPRDEEQAFALAHLGENFRYMVDLACHGRDPKNNPRIEMFTRKYKDKFVTPLFQRYMELNQEYALMSQPEDVNGALKQFLQEKQSETRSQELSWLHSLKHGDLSSAQSTLLALSNADHTDAKKHLWHLAIAKLCHVASVAEEQQAGVGSDNPVPFAEEHDVALECAWYQDQLVRKRKAHDLPLDLEGQVLDPESLVNHLQETAVAIAGANYVDHEDALWSIVTAASVAYDHVGMEKAKHVFQGIADLDAARLDALITDANNDPTPLRENLLTKAWQHLIDLPGGEIGEDTLESIRTSVIDHLRGKRYDEIKVQQLIGVIMQSPDDEI